MIQKDFNGKERRVYIRLQKSLPVRFRIEGSREGKTYLATTRNISRGGLCVEIAQEIEDLLEKISAPGHKIGIAIDTLIPNQTMAVSAKSVWINSRLEWAREPTKKERTLLMGIKFEEMADESHRRIYDFIVKEMVERYEKPD